MELNRSKNAASSEPFSGFEHLTANFIYCPNQFFDVCLSHSSRGVVRLVAYLLRRTLGWLDKNGEPIEQDISVSYTELVEHAGISRGAIRPAIDEAIQAGLVSLHSDWPQRRFWLCCSDSPVPTLLGCQPRLRERSGTIRRLLRPKKGIALQFRMRSSTKLWGVSHSPS